MPTTSATSFRMSAARRRPPPCRLSLQPLPDTVPSGGIFGSGFRAVRRLVVQQHSQGTGQVLFQRGGYLVVVAVCAAHRLLDHVVDQAAAVQVFGGDLYGLGGLFGLLAAAFPQDAGAALGTDHRVVRVLEHRTRSPTPMPSAPPEPPSPITTQRSGRQPRHREDVLGDRRAWPRSSAPMPG